jgi:hypothetical protein
MQASLTYVRAKYPRAEAGVKGGTGEMDALGKSVSTYERWVIAADNCPDAAMLGEGSSIETAWKNAAKNLRTALG